MMTEEDVWRPVRRDQTWAETRGAVNEVGEPWAGLEVAAGMTVVRESWAGGAGAGAVEAILRGIGYILRGNRLYIPLVG